MTALAAVGVLLVVGQVVIVYAAWRVICTLNESTASTNLLLSTAIGALRDIALIRASDRLIEPSPAPFTSEESLR